MTHAEFNAMYGGQVMGRLLYDGHFRFVNANRRHTWHREEGLLLLRRHLGKRSPRPLHAAVVGWVPRPAAQVSSHSGVTFDGDHVYWVWPEKVGRGGVRALSSNRLTRAVVYQAGAHVGLIPETPANLSGRQTTGRKVVLSWLYNPLDEQTAAAQFKLYHDDGSGTIDWNNPIGTVSYLPGQFLYSYTTGQYAAGARIAFSVRAVTAAGVKSLIPEQADMFKGSYEQYDDIPVAKTIRIEIVERTISDPEVASFA